MNSIHLTIFPTHQSNSNPKSKVVPETDSESEVIRLEPMKTGKAAPQPWTTEEETVLARVWVDVPEDLKVGKNQDTSTFSGKLLGIFSWKWIVETIGKDQIYLKWWKINKVVMEFNVLFSTVKRQWQSGANDKTILQKALSLYGSKKGYNFQISSCLEYHEDVKKVARYWKFGKVYRRFF